jgi:hypothetical protein
MINREFLILVKMKRKLVKAQHDLFKPIVKKLQDVTPRTSLPTKREFEHHKCLEKKVGGFIWSLYHKAIVVNIRKAKVNQLSNITSTCCMVYTLKKLIYTIFSSIIKQEMHNLEL